VNPVGSALVFAEQVGNDPPRFYRSLARHLAMPTFSFLLITEYLGSLLLRFFGLTLPIVQIAGGLVMAATAWQLLFEKDSTAGAQHKRIEIGGDINKERQLLGRGLLSVYVSDHRWPGNTCHDADAQRSRIFVCSIGKASYSRWNCPYRGVAQRIGLLLLRICGAHAWMGVGALHGILRIMAFILMCNGAKVLWGGPSSTTEYRPWPSLNLSRFRLVESGFFRCPG
jgi:multiple antibiotic resistance protein